MMFSISALNCLETNVHQFVLLLAMTLAVMCMATFLYLIDYAARLLRPISILTRTAETGLRVIEHLYPAPTEAPDVAVRPSPALGAPDRVVAHTGASQVVLAIELLDLIAAARGGRHRAVDFLGGISSVKMNRCSRSMAAQMRSTKASCGTRSCSAPSALWSRTRLLVPHRRGYRTQGPVPCHQRSDDGSAGDRSAASPVGERSANVSSAMR